MVHVWLPAIVTALYFFPKSMSASSTSTPSSANSTSAIRRLTGSLVRQAGKSYNASCLVLLQDEVGLSRLSGLEDGSVSGVTSAEDPSTFRRMSKKSGCVVLVAAMPDQTWEVANLSRSLWPTWSPQKVLILVQNNDTDDSNVTNFIPAINTTFPHVLVRPDGKGSAKALCLTSNPPSVVNNYADCRSLSELLEGITLTVSYYGTPPTIIYSNPPSGTDPIIVNFLSQILGFEVNYVKEMALDNTRTIVGLIQKVGEGISDMGIGGALQDWQRNQKVDFCTPTGSSQIYFITPAPRSRNVFDTLLLPYDLITWLLVFASIAALTLAMLFIDWFFGQRVTQKRLYRAFIIVYSSVLGYELPYGWFRHKFSNESFSKGVVVSITLVTAFFLNNAYKSTLRSNLYTEEFSAPLRTPAQILASGLPVFVPRGTVMVAELRNASSSVLRKIFNESVVAKSGLYTMVDGQIPDDKAALLETGDAILVSSLKSIVTLNSTFSTSSDPLLSSYTGYTVPKGSRLKNQFMIPILRLNEGGLVAAAASYLLGGNDPIKQHLAKQQTFRIKEENDPLKITQVMLIFIALAVGLLAAAVSLVAELVLGRRRAEANHRVGAGIFFEVT